MKYTPLESRTKNLKYRPSLTADQIEFILRLTKQFYIDLTGSPELDLVEANQAFAVIATLTPFQAKIRNLAITPAYIPSDTPAKTSTLESLGGTDSDTHIPTLPSYDDSIGVPETNLSSLPPISKEELWAASYAKYLIDPVSCTIQEIEEAREHKYLENLMTVEEVEAFELDMVSKL